MCISGLISDCLSSLFVVLTVSSRVEGGRDDKVDNCLFDTDVVVIIRNQHHHHHHHHHYCCPKYKVKLKYIWLTLGSFTGQMKMGFSFFYLIIEGKLVAAVSACHFNFPNRC